MTDTNLFPADPARPTPVDQYPATPVFSLTGTLANDLKMAALGSMASSVLTLSGRSVNIGVIGFVLFSVGELAMFWGLLQVGRLYHLRWVCRGSKLLMVANLIGCLPVVTSSPIGSFADNLSNLLAAIGTIITFTDLWGLRHDVDKRLVTAVVAGFVAGRFILALELISQSFFDLFEAVTIGLLAWLFYLVAEQSMAINTPNTPPPSA